MKLGQDYNWKQIKEWDIVRDESWWINWVNFDAKTYDLSFLKSSYLEIVWHEDTNNNIEGTKLESDFGNTIIYYNK